ncbi:MAG: hypothetical protein MUC63_00730 [Planctomycetes bacterium]|jgi:hypothetical protein|nr:hypothetical protein [Planctomycetota bacterium]
MNRRDLVRKAVLGTGFVVLFGGNLLIFILWPDRWWLLSIPLVIWGVLHIVYATLTLKDPKYYG